MILVTGSNGFIGQAVCEGLRRRGASVRPVVRLSGQGEPNAMAVGDIGPDTEWRPALEGVERVVHCAARVHVMREHAQDALSSYRQVNVAGTRRLALQAAEMGVRRLVFVSSVKVHGEWTRPGIPFRVTDVLSPMDPYAVSKWEAEQVLQEVSGATGLEVVIVRPPLVYGPGVGANFRRLMALVWRGAPVPLGKVNNRRSMVGMGNLVDILSRCSVDSGAVGKAFLVSDGLDVSTPELVRALARAMGRPARLMPVPLKLLRFGGWLAGRVPEVERLIGSLQVDVQYTRETLDWTPLLSVEEELQKTVDAFLREQR